MDKQKSILIIEDDADLIEAMKIILETKNYWIFAAYSPGEGFQMAKDVKPDLIILDVMFGSKERSLGFEYAVKMKRDKILAPIPILMSTAVNEAHLGLNFSPKKVFSLNWFHRFGEYLPVDDFIDKPAQPDDLLKRIEKLLQQKISKWVNYPKKS